MTEQQPFNHVAPAPQDPAAAPIPTSMVAQPQPTTPLEIARQLHAKEITIQQAGTLAKAGGFDLAEIARAHAALNQPAEAATPDTRTDTERQADTLYPPGLPTEYQIPWNLGDAPLPPEVKEVDTSVRNWLVEAGLPREHGNSLVKTIDHVGMKLSRMSDGEREAYGLNEFSKLKQAHGDKLEARLGQVKTMLDAIRATHPEFAEFFRNHQAVFDDAMVANQLISHAEHYHARRRT